MNKKIFSFNQNDMLIIFAIWINSKNNMESSVGIIRQQINIAPNNLTVHIKKLKEMEIIIIPNVRRGEKKDISLNLRNKANSSLVNGIVNYFILNEKKFQQEINRIRLVLKQNASS